MGSNAASKLLRAVTSFSKTNSPILTTVVGASGVVAVAVLAAQAGAKSSLQIRDAWGAHNPSAKEKVREVWPNFIPTAVMAGVTIGAIVTGHRVGATRAAAATTALALSERTFNDYRERIVERLGADDERKVRDEVRLMEARREEQSQIVLVGDSNILCYDSYSGRYFKSDKQEIRRALNDTRDVLWQQSYVSLSDFYDALGIPNTSSSDHVGWNNDHPLDVYFDAILSPDDTPCLSMQFSFEPNPNFANFAGGSST